MFEIDQEDFTLQDVYWSVGALGGEAGFIATRPVNGGAPLDASWTASRVAHVAFALVVTITAQP